MTCASDPGLLYVFGVLIGLALGLVYLLVTQ